jgi:trans-aconitate 2-methyltransferase
MEANPVLDWGVGFANKFDLAPFRKIVDIGRRQGKITSYLASRYSEQNFTAIDNVHSEIELAIHYKLPNVSFLTQDALDLNYPEYFDAVVSFSCLHWIKNKIKILQAIYQVLKPGGKAFSLKNG